MSRDVTSNTKSNDNISSDYISVAAVVIELYPNIPHEVDARLSKYPKTQRS